MDIFGALWLADYAGAFLTAGGNGLYHFHFFPRPLSQGCHGQGTFEMFTADENYQIKQETSQYFASRLINLEWMKPTDEVHHLYRAWCDVRDPAGHALVTAYAVERPDGEWSLMLVNRDQMNVYTVRVVFEDSIGNRHGSFAGPVTMVTFGSEQYVWHSDPAPGHADPDGPPLTATLPGGREASFTLPKASISVLRAKVEGLTG